MHSTLCTIGFTRKTAEEFFCLLQEASVRKVIDIREHRIGQLSGFAKFPDIAFFLERIAGISYAHAPELAPSPEIRKAYQRSKDWPAYESAFLQLMRERQIPEKVAAAEYENGVALLCSEPGPEKCHRRLVAELLAEHWRAQGHTIEIRHLLVEKSVRKKRKKGKRAVGDDKASDH